MSDLCQVVNENDEIIGHKRRQDIDPVNDIYRIAALWLTNNQGQVLISQRLLSKRNDPGKWGVAAAGTIEEGETYESNIYKEAEEEIGLTGVKFSLGPKQRFGAPREAFCQWFIGKCDWSADKFKPQVTEVEQVLWVEPDWLKGDVQQNPDKYAPSMPLILDALL